jgi:hypothetical protein
MLTVEKFFNTAGPGIPEDHYMVDPLRRVDYDEIAVLIDQKRYFVLYAPPRAGKTTSLLAMAKKINEEGQYHCVYMNVKSDQAASDDVKIAMRAILTELGEKIERLLGDAEPLKKVPKLLEDAGAYSALSSLLGSLCRKTSLPVVLFIDGIETLAEDTLMSVLHQLRAAYIYRPQTFPASVLLCGMRDIGGSCFNIKAAALRLGDFSQEEVRELYEQHTAATGQVFEENIYPRVWELTHGQPWLVNALAYQATFKMEENRDRSRSITLDIIKEAVNQMILEQTTHFDQLTDKLREPRVHRVIASMTGGENWLEESAENLSPDDIRYVIDLGLIRNDGGDYVIANAIYREFLPRALSRVKEIACFPTDWSKRRVTPNAQTPKKRT